MAKRWRVKPNRDLRENARLVVPMMMDSFLDRRDRVLGHPKLKNELHRMRLAGKTLRYAMEVFASAFGNEFDSCLEEVKNLLDTMGNIHDCDVHIPKLETCLREARLFNKATNTPQDKVLTGPMVTFIQEQRQLRSSLFTQLSDTIEQWVRQNFKGRVIQSMLVPSQDHRL